MIFALNFALFLIAVSLFAHTVVIKKSRSWYEYLPTMFWQGLMVSSFLLQYSHFDQKFVGTQGLCIAFFSIAILLGDWAAIPTLNRKWSIKGFQSHHFGYCLIVIAASFHTIHLYMMPEIPLVTKLTDKLTPLWDWLTTGSFTEIDQVEADAKYMQLRENSSKLLKVPQLFIYLSHGFLMVLAPFSVAICLKNKKWMATLASLSFFLFYSRASLSKGTALLFLALVLLHAWFQFPDRFRKLFFKICLPIGFVFAIYPIYFLSSHPGSLLNYQIPQEKLDRHFETLDKEKKPPRLITLGDRSRFFEAKDLPFELKPREKTVNYFLYRAFLVPVEVSHFWYQYYPKLSGNYLGFYGLTPSSRNSADFVHPANTLGKWAYQARFPTHYLDSVRAYCSIDADSHSRFGLWGSIFIAFIVLITRLAWKFLRVPGVLGSGFYACFLFVFGSSLPAASLFAIMVAKGGALFFMIAFLLIYIDFENYKEL